MIALGRSKDGHQEIPNNEQQIQGDYTTYIVFSTRQVDDIEVQLRETKCPVILKLVDVLVCFLENS